MLISIVYCNDSVGLFWTCLTLTFFLTDMVWHCFCFLRFLFNYDETANTFDLIWFNTAVFLVKVNIPWKFHTVPSLTRLIKIIRKYSELMNYCATQNWLRAEGACVQSYTSQHASDPLPYHRKVSCRVQTISTWSMKIKVIFLYHLICCHSNMCSAPPPQCPSPAFPISWYASLSSLCSFFSMCALHLVSVNKNYKVKLRHFLTLLSLISE